MDRLSSRWQTWLKNLGWYLLTLVVLIVLFSFIRSFIILPALWLVGLIWGGVLAYQFSQLLLNDTSSTVSEARLQGYLDQAQAYQQKIKAAIEATPGEASRIRLERLITQIDQWTEAIHSLVQRLNHLGQDDLLRRDLKEVPKAIADLEKRLAQESDEIIRQQLERTLVNRRKQLAALQELQSLLKRSEIQIESTLSALGTIYSQILTGQSTSQVADYDHLSVEVDEEVRQLEDQLEALHEVKLGGDLS